MSTNTSHLRSKVIGSNAAAKLTIPKVFVFFTSPSKVTVLYLELGCDRFLPSPSQFILTNGVLQALHLTLCYYKKQNSKEECP